MDDFDLATFTPYLLAIAAERESLDFASVYKGRYGMTRPEWRTLFHLGRYGAMTATALGRRAHIHKTKISRAVAALERKRFVRREKVEHDRRAETLDLTPAGRRAYDDLRGHAERFETALAARLGPEDTAAMTRILQRLVSTES